MSEVQGGHNKSIAHEYCAREEAARPTSAQRSRQDVHEDAGKDEMKKHGIAISNFRRKQVEKKSERIEDCGFEMRPEGHSSEEVRIPVWDLMVKAHFVVKEVFHSKIKGDKIFAGQKMS